MVILRWSKSCYWLELPPMLEIRYTLQWQFLKSLSLSCNTNNISLCSQNQTTPLHLASEKDHVQSIELLLQHNAIVNSTEKVHICNLQIPNYNYKEMLMKFILPTNTHTHTHTSKHIH